VSFELQSKHQLSQILFSPTTKQKAKTRPAKFTYAAKKAAGLRFKHNTFLLLGVVSEIEQQVMIDVNECQGATVDHSRLSLAELAADRKIGARDRVKELRLRVQN